MTQGGDLMLGPEGDLLVRIDRDELADGITFRLRTYLGDYYLHPEIGTQLESYIGEPNIKPVLEAAAEEIIYALTFDGFIDESLLIVRGIPVNTYEALFAIQVYDGASEIPYTFSIPFSFLEGYLNII